MYKNTELDRDAVMDGYEKAKKRYAAFGVDADSALKKLSTIPISIHCWQGDDVAGFEGASGITGGGIMATGNYPGRARNVDELRADYEKACTMIPGTHRFNLHASYLDAPGKKIDRDQIEPVHFRSWIEWARAKNIALDFNPTFFSHPKANDGYTLASKDAGIRKFWIEHGKRSRKVAEELGRELGSPCLNNFWIPDGSKDMPADRLGHRNILISSLDEIFSEKLDENHTIDAVESKLFGLASEAYVVGSHEFYLSYALSRGVLLTLDAGHYHPTEQISEKISAILPFTNRLMLHVSRPVRWDSDHVVILDDWTRNIAIEIKRANAFDSVFIALDFFDASINRIAAWVIGVRSTLKALLYALLEPSQLLREEEESGRLAHRLALMEELKTMPFGAVWDRHCLDAGVPIGAAWLSDVEEYEKNVLRKRGA